MYIKNCLRRVLEKCIKVVLRASEWCIMEKLFVSFPSAPAPLCALAQVIRFPSAVSTNVVYCKSKMSVLYLEVADVSYVSFVYIMLMYQYQSLVQKTYPKIVLCQAKPNVEMFKK